MLAKITPATNPESDDATFLPNWNGYRRGVSTEKSDAFFMVMQ
jgi:hypothetical protein